MNPVSLYFLAFLIGIVVLFYAVPQRIKVPLLAASSLAFIWIGGLPSLLILVATILFNYFFAFKISKQENLRKRHLFLVLGLSINIGLLVVIKYHNVLNRGSHRITQFIGIDNPMPPLHWLIPLGLSYYIFQALGYQIEVYRKTHEPERSLAHLTTYLGFFPKLTAGPIERSYEFLPQLRSPFELRYENISNGLRLVLWGFFKFMFVSGWIKSLIDPAFQQESGAIPMSLALVLYTVQLYTQFSGYTDIAIGCTRLFGINLRQNFHLPFRSKSLSDFWRRWHMSLSSWVMDYIYTPLSLWLSLRIIPGKFSIALSVFLSFFLLGMWHGTDWNFAVFGFIQGSVLALEIATHSWRKKYFSGRRSFMIGGVLTMLVFILSSVFFRAQNIPEAQGWFTQATTDWSSLASITSPQLSIILLSAVFIILDHTVLANGFEKWVDNKNPIIRWMIYGILIYAILAGSGVDIQNITYGGF